MMEEVGSHEEEEEQVITASVATHGNDSVISDALQEAALPFLPDVTALNPTSLITSSDATVTMMSTSSVGTAQHLFQPIAPTIPTLPNMSLSAGTSPLADWTSAPSVPSWTPTTAGMTFTGATSLPSVPTNLSTPTRPPVYQSQVPPPVAVSSSVGAEGAPPPPPTGGFVPSHGIVTATPGKHHSTLPMGPPSSLASHLLTPATVDQQQPTNYTPQQQQQQQQSMIGSYSPSAPSQHVPSYSQPMAGAMSVDYAPGMMQTSYESTYPLGPAGVRVEPAPPSPQRSDRFFGWLPGSGLMHRVIEKTKSSVESVITTLDPGMKDVIYSGGTVNIVVTSAKEVKVGAIRQAFQSVFGRATVTGMECQPNIAPQPVGYSSGVRGAEERIENLRQSGTVDEQQAIVSVESFIVELLTDRWFDVGCILLKDPRYGVDLMTFTQATPVPPEFVCAAQDATSPDYPLRWSGLQMTIGQAVQQMLPHVDQSDWHVYYTGVSRREMLVSAARSLAGMYRTQLQPGSVM